MSRRVREPTAPHATGHPTSEPPACGREHAFFWKIQPGTDKNRPFVFKNCFKWADAHESSRPRTRRVFRRTGPELVAFAQSKIRAAQSKSRTVAIFCRFGHARFERGVAAAAKKARRLGARPQAPGLVRDLGPKRFGLFPDPGRSICAVRFDRFGGRQKSGPARALEPKRCGLFPDLCRSICAVRLDRTAAVWRPAKSSVRYRTRTRAPGAARRHCTTQPRRRTGRLWSSVLIRISATLNFKLRAPGPL